MDFPSRGAYDEFGQCQLEVKSIEEERSDVGEKGGWQVIGKRSSDTAENRGDGLIHI